MSRVVYRVIWGPWRFYMPIGIKTLTSLLLIIVCLAGGIYYYTIAKLAPQIEREAMESLNSKLQGGWRLYHSRMDQMKYGLLQAISERHIVDAVAARDTKLLRELLNGYALNRPYVDLWAVVDEKRRVLARRNERTGDLLEIGGIVEKALTSGEVFQSAEKVDLDTLAAENPKLSAMIERTGVMQVVVVPVSRDGTVVGAFVTGILLNNYDWLPNAIYEHFSTESAVFGSILQESRIIASTSLPKSVFSPLLRIPSEVNAQVSAGRSFRGKTLIEGVDAYVNAEPIFNSSREPIGGLAVGIYASEVSRLIRDINREIYLYTAIGMLISLVLAVLAYRDTSVPIHRIISAMNEAAAGNFDVRTEIRTKDEFERIGAGFNAMLEHIQVREARIDRFNELSKLLITSLDPVTLLNKALVRVVELTDSHMGIVYLYDEGTDMLKPTASYGVGEGCLKGIQMGEGLPGICAVEKRAIVLTGIPDDSLILEAGFANIRPKGVAWFAMCYKNRLLGVFAIGSLRQYNEGEIKHLEYLVAQIAIALDNATNHKLIEQLSITDALTGLNNRRHLYERLGTAFAEAKRYNHSLSLVIIDIDNFKQINDTMGHQQGDSILREIGAILRENSREPDLWARYGGEEFIGYFPHCEKDDGYRVAEKIRRLIAEHEFTGMDGRQVTISGGITCYPGPGIESVDDMVGAADRLLYESKRSGKNRVMAE